MSDETKAPETPDELWGLRGKSGKLLGHLAEGYIGTFFTRDAADAVRPFVADRTATAERIGVSPARLEAAEAEVARLRERAEKAEKERNKLIGACIARNPFASRDCFRFQARVAGGTFWLSTQAEAVAAVRKAAGLDAESEADVRYSVEASEDRVRIVDHRESWVVTTWTRTPAMQAKAERLAALLNENPDVIGGEAR